MDPYPQHAPSQPDLSAALHRLWIQFLPQTVERAAVLASAAAALNANQLSTEQQQAAHAAAHKLAGTLGTFGLAEGTSLAREAELLYAADPHGSASRLTEIAARLRSLIHSHGS
jgi:HPt (histidine-containing phosphotransfer) domain-containing protein